jgi:hypothetical protein
LFNNIVATIKIKGNKKLHPIAPAIILTLVKYKKNIDKEMQSTLWLYQKLYISQKIPRIKNV